MIKPEWIFYFFLAVIALNLVARVPRDPLSHKSLLWRYVAPVFIWDVVQWNKTNNHDYVSILRIAVFLFLVCAIIWSGTISAMQWPRFVECDISSFFEVPTPFLYKHGVIAWQAHAVQYFVGVIVLNAAAARMLPHSLLAYSVARAVMLEKTLPSTWLWIRQLDHETVRIAYREPVTIKQFKACEDELQCAGGLDVEEIRERKHGEIEIKCRFAGEAYEQRPYYMAGSTMKFGERDQSFVYFVRDGITSEVKIGRTVNPQTILTTLRRSNPRLEFHILSDGAEAYFPETSTCNEKYLHRKFAHLRNEREFFEWCPEIENFIEQHYAKEICNV